MTLLAPALSKAGYTSGLHTKFQFVSYIGFFDHLHTSTFKVTQIRYLHLHLVNFTAALHLLAPCCSITFTDVIKLLTDIFKMDELSANAGNGCFLLCKPVFNDR